MLEVVGEGLLLSLEYDAMGRFRAVGTREVRQAHSCAEETKGDQECHQDLGAKIFDAGTYHRVSR